MIASLIKALVKYGVMLLGLFFISFIPSLVVCQILRLNPNMTDALKKLALLLSGVMFAVGWIILFKKHDMTYTKYPMVIGTVIPPILLLVSFVPILLTLTIDAWVLILIGIALSVAILWSSVDWLKGKAQGGMRVPSILVPSSGTGNLVGAIEVKEIPDIFVADRESSWEPEKVAQSTLNIIRSTITARIPYGLRIERISGINKLVFVTHASNPMALNNHLDHLQSAIRAYYTGFLVERVGIFKPPVIPPSTQFVSAQMMGEPMVFDGANQSQDGLTSTIETLLTMTDGIVQVFVAPAKSNALKRRSLRKSFEKERKKSQTTVAKPITGMFKSEHSETQTQVDVLSSAKARKLGRELARHEAESPCDVGLYVTCWDAREKVAEQNARMLIQSMSGSFTPADHTADFKQKILKHKNDSEKLVKGHPVGKFTFLLIDEAAVFFVPPRNEMGLRTSKRESFSTATREMDEQIDIQDIVPHQPLQPVTEVISREPIGDDRYWRISRSNFIVTGRIIDRAGNVLSKQFVVFGRNELQSHMMVTGTTRTGKTNTAMLVVAQLTRNGVYPIVLAPKKAEEWFKLKSLFDEFWIFTAGNPEISALRLNIWNPPEGVLLSKWIESLSKGFHALLPNDDVITMHFKVVLYTVYDLCGWDVENNTKGRPIMLDDLVRAVKHVGSRLEYGKEVKANFIGALLSRVVALLRNSSIVDMYNTKHGITFKELLDNPIIIDMESLNDDDARFLSAMLAIGLTEYRLANPVSEIRNVLVLEEAHILLKKPIETGAGIHTTQQIVVDSITGMFRISGGIGLPVILCEQLPSSLADEVAKLPSNLIAHAQHDQENEQLVGTIARCDTSQTKHIAGMKKGEAIVYLEKDAVAKNVQVLLFNDLFTVPLPTWTRERVKKSMLPVFEAKGNEWQSERISISEIEKMASIEKEVVMPLDNQEELDKEVSRLTALPSYKNLYVELFQNVGSTGYKPLVDLIERIAEKVKSRNVNPKETFLRIAHTSRRLHGIPTDDALFEGLLSRIDEAIV